MLLRVKPLKIAVMLWPLLLAPANAQETVLGCETLVENQVARIVCEQRPVTSTFKVPLPPDDPVQVSITAPGEKAASAIAVPVVVPLPEDVSATAVVIPTEAPKPELKIGAPNSMMPAEVMQAALQRLANSKKLDKASFDELAAFYKSRTFEPLWLEKGGWSASAKSLQARLGAAEEDGLEASRYRSVTTIIETSRPEWPALAAAELELSASIITFANDIGTGRVVPNQVHAMITPKLERLESGKILATLHQADSGKEAGKALHDFAPPQEGYHRLRKRLAELRSKRQDHAGLVIPDGPVLRVGMRDRRVPLLRLKLEVTEGIGDIYDEPLAAKVAAFQRSVRQQANTMITAQTLKALNSNRSSAEEADVIANMEFWRWLPRDLGKDHIFVNIPSYGLQMLQNSKVVHEARVIVGTGETQTPIFSDMMDHVVINPSWFVPPSIFKKDPRYLDPAWVKARGYTMIKRRNSVIVRVPPSATNALGNIKFMFPNDHAVYLHDTPSRKLFNARNRVLSNGCVRVENPFKLAAKIFEKNGLSEDGFKRLVGSGEQRMNLPAKLPIHLAYFTTEVDTGGTLITHQDVYGHAARLKKLLGLT